MRDNVTKGCRRCSSTVDVLRMHLKAVDCTAPLYVTCVCRHCATSAVGCEIALLLRRSLVLFGHGTDGRVCRVGNIVHSVLRRNAIDVFTER